MSDAMIKTSVSWTESGPDKLAHIRQQLKIMEKAYVSVGVHSDAGQYTGPNAPSVVEVALWMEFGTRTVPERSWLRASIAESEARIEKWRDEIVDQILEGKLTVEKGLHIIGQRLVTIIQGRIKAGIEPELAASTLAQHKRDGVGTTPLMVTQLLLRSITYRVVLG